jgi:hypothetical protein
MKKVLLPIAAVIIVLCSGAFLVKPSQVETPQEKQKRLIPITAQRSDDGKIVTDPELWDQNKGFFTAYLVVE